MTEKLLIGAHTSAAGGVHHALLQGKEIGATTIQLFTSNQRRWETKPIPESEVELWKRTIEETGLQKIMSHDSYLINLGAPDPIILEKSRKAFKEEYERCLQLGLAFLNFHPGAALTEDAQQCLDRIVESLLELKALCQKGNTKLLLEATAGQGSNVGYRFEQLAYIIDRVKKDLPIGVCIDTCHIFAAGYDIRTKECWQNTLNEFEQVVGLQYLQAFHLNDSAKGLGSRVDRHSSLGKGEIGLESFRFLMTNPKTRHIPKYLETPEGPLVWKSEIEILKEMAGE